MAKPPPSDASAESAKICGIIRPISPLPGYPDPNQFNDVHDIVAEAMQPLGFEVRLVSEADGAGIIPARIVQRLYADEVVICDISGHNPNVMLELGLRLAFDKPVVIIKDTVTKFIFDIHSIEQCEYPSDLRRPATNTFIEKLRNKVRAEIDDPTSFVQQFGPIRTVRIETELVPMNEYLLDKLQELSADVSVIGRELAQQKGFQPYSRPWNDSDSLAETGRALSPLVSAMSSGFGRHDTLRRISLDGLSPEAVIKALSFTHTLVGPTSARIHRATYGTTLVFGLAAFNANDGAEIKAKIEAEVDRLKSERA